MRLLFIFLSFFLSFSFAETDRIQKIALDLMHRQFVALSNAVHEKNLNMILEHYYLPDIFPPNQTALNIINNLFTGAHFVPVIGYFTTKSIFDGYLYRIQENGNKDMYHTEMRRNAWSPTDWKIFALDTDLNKLGNRKIDQ